jgi:hypothetical protein
MFRQWQRERKLDVFFRQKSPRCLLGLGGGGGLLWNVKILVLLCIGGKTSPPKF